MYDKMIFGTASVHVESEALKKKSNELGKMGYGAMSRLVYRPLHDTGRLFQLGISGAYETPRYNSEPTLNHTSFDLGLISRRVLQSQSCECLDSGCKEPDKIYTGDDSRIWSCGIGSTILLSSSEPEKDLRIIKRVVCMEY